MATTCAQCLTRRSSRRGSSGARVSAVRAQIDEAAFTAAWAEGRAMTLEQVIAYTLEDSTRALTE